ncbi:DUF4340 domain-containing protein [Limisphaera ngatamarikiensis]|uniref:DUF4340 domain-containing protein n=1 Tax=Limisphaera ngatamarikiensis TaxID=1324935 RepID=A0A6M1RNK2_9BACT|nr:DUF4340 domain-containing protein [Limisphaera ngatamarikiensis]NGO39139.1 DUF4340 domain-containing protein [Limisphaera ngatamarikiensis]
MNRKQFLLLLGLVIVLGGAAWWLYRQEGRTWQRTGVTAQAKLLPDLPVNEVAHVRIRQGTNELNLVRKDGLWRVQERGGYPANFQQISDWIVKASELKAVQAEEVGPSQLWRLSLLPPGPETNTATLVEFLDGSGRRLGGLLLGKTQSRASATGLGGGTEDGFPAGRWVMTLSATNRALMISDPLYGIEPRPEQWISKEFFKVERPRLVRVEFPDASRSWAMRREKETDSWQLVDARPGETLDGSKATSATSGLSWPSFLDVLPPDTPPEQVGLDRPVKVYIETFDDFVYDLSLGEKTNQSYHLRLTVSANLPEQRTPAPDEKPEDKERLDREFKEKRDKLAEKLAQEKRLEGWIYQVSTWTFDSLLKPRDEMLTQPPASAGQTDAASQGGESDGSGEHTGDEWTRIPELEE